MFNLNQAIAEWRKKMMAGGIKTPAVLDELESHLREEVENQIRAGADAERAFAAATARMGEAGCLKREFEKIPDSEKEQRRKRRWIASTFAGTGLAYSVVFATLIFERRSTHLEITRGEFLLELGSMVATLLFAFAGRYFARFLPTVAREWQQAAVIILGVFFVAILFQIIWAFLPLNRLVQAQVILLWTMSPLPGLGNLFGAWCERCSAERKQLNAGNA